MSDELSIMAEGETNARPSRHSGSCFTWSGILLALGAAALFFGLSAETVAPDSEVLNIGLMQNQLILVNGGMMLFGTGIIGMFISCLIETIERRVAQ